jgi:hypothetical protein
MIFYGPTCSGKSTLKRGNESFPHDVLQNILFILGHLGIIENNFNIKNDKFDGKLIDLLIFI